MGVFEEAKGKVKEVVGDVTDNPDLQREGKAQAAKGEEEREATQARAEAKAHEAKAEAHEAEQEIAESSK
ncbi:MAG TPA: CsbD family protein [Acidimicrobiales bacterium]|nr:CsbD family protein [Acidimicrobiales bacterium]